MKKELTLSEQIEILNELTQYQMCYMWRFHVGNPDYFDNTKEISKSFSHRLFNHFGGFTPEISKQLGW
jgi:hypothetical protein